jgi:hypothetical protein
MCRMAAFPPLYSRPEIFQGKQCTLGAALAWPWKGRASHRVLNGVGRYSGGITVGEAAMGFKGQDGRSMMGLTSGDEDGMEARPSTLCHTTARRTGRTLRRRDLRVTGSVGGPGLPERVELIRAALPDADRARFDQDWTRLGHGPVDPGPAATRPRGRGLVAGGVRSPAQRPAVGGDRGAAAPW